MTDYYAILGVSRNATQSEIRDAYLKLARDTHPDRVKDPVERKRAEDVFKNVTAAYDTLSRDKSRRDYTSKLPTVSETRTPPPKAAPPVVQGPPLASRPGPAAAPASTGSPIASAGGPGVDLLAQGIEAYKKQDYHTAVQLLNLAVNKDEKNARAHAMLALSMAKNPNWIRDALSHMETASKLEPRNVTYLVECALLLHSQGLKLRAKRALDSAIAINPEHPDVARALKEIPTTASEPEAPARNTGETPKGLFDRLRKR
jgi:tetratricopeptide (TPR) repeat protein